MDFKFLFYVVTAIATIVAAVLNVRINRKNIEIAKEERFIDTITAERVKWLNTLRDTCSEYLKLAIIQMNDFQKWKAEGIENINEDELRERSFEMRYISSRIYLSLNQTEPINEKLIDLQSEITNILGTNNISEFESKKIIQSIEDLQYLQQVVLKSEWRRIKEENKLGTEMKDDRMNEIFMSTALKMDPMSFKRLGFHQPKQLEGNNIVVEQPKVRRKYMVLHLLIWVYAVLTFFVIVSIGFSAIGMNCLSIFSSDNMLKFIAAAGFLFTMFGILPIIEENFKYKK
ncbi:hypothetical protein [Bacillus sp. B3-WWTP-C-10-D-3]|uniref:hypothetical protein n=1 Tax=Bacillus sp. B3-WWTP-C-10-D-3 TaxID=2653217 RepID=UPI0012619A63|nr:hypothetical protein [Bacillus sp. B3-WWTP-C-10-D-3]KAB7635270.1 hypothetical protein GBN83_24850 [Bacillus sp. B3-WWTP-C-10-D-3]